MTQSGSRATRFAVMHKSGPHSAVKIQNRVALDRDLRPVSPAEFS